jgi:hypothetical protein
MKIKEQKIKDEFGDGAKQWEQDRKGMDSITGKKKGTDESNAGAQDGLPETHAEAVPSKDETEVVKQDNAPPEEQKPPPAKLAAAAPLAQAPHQGEHEKATT